MKVLMLGPGRSLKGGVSSVVNAYYEAGLGEKVNLTYLETYTDGNKAEKLNAAIKAIYKFKECCKDTDIVHIHMASRASFYRKSIFVNKAKRMNKKIILHIHGAEFEKFYKEESNEIMKKYIRYIFSKSDKVIALSSKWKDILKKIVDESKITVIYNSIVCPKQHLDKNYNNEKILFLGRLGNRKGVYDILKCASRIIAIFPNVEFILAGDGEVDNVRELCNKMGIKNNFRITGWIDGAEKEKLLNEASIYLLPSYNEGMPISVLEAMAYGLPVISTNIGGIPELIDNDENGFLIEPGDINGITNSLIKLLEDNNKKRRFGENAFLKAKNNFNVENKINDLYELYYELIRSDYNV